MCAAGTLKGTPSCACKPLGSVAASRVDKGKHHSAPTAAASSAASVFVPAAASLGSRAEANNIVPHSGLGQELLTQHAQVIIRLHSTVPSMSICVTAVLQFLGCRHSRLHVWPLNCPLQTTTTVVRCPVARAKSSTGRISKLHIMP